MNAQWKYQKQFNPVGLKAGVSVWSLARVIDEQTPARVGRGYDPSSLEHGTGRALDIMFTRVGGVATGAERVVGDMVVSWLVKNAKRMHIRHIIWFDRIYKVRFARWEALRNRKGNSDRHLDHAHVYFEDNNGTVPPFRAEPIDKETEMDANELAGAILRFPITANGKTAPLAQHFAEMVNATMAQSLAVSEERTRDRANTDAILAELRTLNKTISGLM